MPDSVRPQPLELQAALAALETVHQNCYQLEKSYMKTWLPSLSSKNLMFEEKLDCSQLDWEAEVMRFKSKQRKARKLVRRVEGIPEGCRAEDYITYRKCSYLATVARWRLSLQAALSPPVSSQLMDVATALYRHSKDRLEVGGVTLQAVLMSDWTQAYLTACSAYYNNYRPHRLESGDWSNANLGSRLGHTLITASLETGRSLTHLALEKLGTDAMLGVVGRTAPALQYLNISHSKVTDRGLLDLCGLRAGRGDTGRARLARGCKAGPATHEWGVVRNLIPRWEQDPGRGCRALQHLEATSLSSLTWHKPYQAYAEYQTVPFDCGFVAMLDCLPLRILNTEVGGRAVATWSRWKRRSRPVSAPQLPLLEVLVEGHPTAALLTQVAATCPALREVRVDWCQFYSASSPSREDWLPALTSVPRLAALLTSDIDHKTDQLRTLLPALGPSLTRLHLQELWHLKYSLLSSIKQSCTGLTKLVVLMTCKEVVGAVAQIHVEKDVDLSLEMGDTGDRGLQRLEELHLMGPFPSQLVRYLVSHTCPGLTSLSLAVEWPEPALCNISPDGRKDYLGSNFFLELLKGNNLTNITELHLMAQNARGRKYLEKEFAMFLFKQFPKLKHLGTFKLWNMTLKQKKDIKAHLINNNLNITIDFDSQPRPSDYEGDFRSIHVSNRAEAACSWLPIKAVNTFTFFEDFADMIAEPAIFWPGNELDDGDDDFDNHENGNDSNDEDEVDVDDDVDQEPLPIGLEPICVIQ